RWRANSRERKEPSKRTSYVLQYPFNESQRSPSPRPSPPGEGESFAVVPRNSRVQTPEPRENIERPTSNTEHRSERGCALPFDVRRWMFDVGCSYGSMGRGVG